MPELIELPSSNGFRMGQLFTDNSFEIPKYQREYSWKKTEVNDFWNDLIELVDGDRSGHFFGQLVTVKNDKSIQEVIDGQQRLTTSSVFLAVLRDIANDWNTNKRDQITDDASDVLRDIRYNIGKCLRGENGEPASLLLQETKTADVRAFFYQLTHQKLGQKLTVPANDPAKKLSAAYTYLKNDVVNELSRYTSMMERVNRLKRIYEYFTNNFYVAMISTPTTSDAFIIFETLNSRGQDLSASDIVKNHLMYVARDQLDSVSEKWEKIADRLKKDGSRITRFIRTYWSARKRLVVKSNLYRSISQEIRNADDANEFLNDLEELVDLYDVLEYPVSPVTNQGYFNNEILAEQVDILSRLNVKLYYPIMLAMKKRNYTEEDMLKVITKIISVFVRHRLIMNEGTNKLESGFADVAQKIYSSELSNVEAINSYLNEKLVKSKEDVENRFMALKPDGGLRGQKKWQLTYLLSGLYDDDDLYQRAIYNDEFKLVHIADKEISADYSNNIGNWMMIEKKLGTKYESAQSLVEKQGILQQSSLVTNQQLAQNLLSWNAESILQRQQRMVRKVTLVW